MFENNIRTIQILIIATTCFLLLFLLIPLAQATEIDDLREKLENVQDQYNGTQDELDKIQTRIDDQNKQIELAEGELSKIKNDLLWQIRDEYRNNYTSNFIDILLNSKNISDFILELEYLIRTKNRQSELLNHKIQTEAEIKNIKKELDESKLQSEVLNEQAKSIMESVESELEEAEEKYRKIYGQSGGGPMEAAPDSGTVVDYARSRIGSPYVWGGSGPNVFDCSGLVMWAYAQVGISLPHQTEAMYAVADEIVPLSEARPGDVLYRPGHVGLCTGYGASSYVHAPTFGAYVREGDPVSWSGFTCALRFS